MYDLHGKRIMVTGATGLIGSALIPRLLQEGAAVRAFTRDPAKAAAAVLGREPVFTREEVRRIERKATWDGAKAMKELGLKPRITIEEGMRRIQAWLPTQGQATG